MVLSRKPVVLGAASSSSFFAVGFLLFFGLLICAFTNVELKGESTAALCCFLLQLTRFCAPSPKKKKKKISAQISLTFFGLNQFGFCVFIWEYSYFLSLANPLYFCGLLINFTHRSLLHEQLFPISQIIST